MTVITTPNFMVGDWVQFIAPTEDHQGIYEVTDIQTLGWSSAVGSQGYQTNVALTIRGSNGTRRDVWQSFCKLDKPPLSAPLSDDPYNEAMAAIEAMEKISG